MTAPGGNARCGLSTAVGGLGDGDGAGPSTRGAAGTAGTALARTGGGPAPAPAVHATASPPTRLTIVSAATAMVSDDGRFVDMRSLCRWRVGVPATSASRYPTVPPAARAPIQGPNTRYPKYLFIAGRLPIGFRTVTTREEPDVSSRAHHRRHGYRAGSCRYPHGSRRC